MLHSLAALPWLPPAPGDFRAQSRALDPGQAGLGRRIQFLALHRLSSPQATSLGRGIARCRAAGAHLSPLTPFRLGVVSSSTVELLVDELTASAARYGIALELVVAPYDQVMQQALDPQAMVNTARCDAVAVLVDQRWLGLDRPVSEAGAAAEVDAAVSRVRAVVEGLRVHGGAPALLQTTPAEPLSLFGHYDRRQAGSPRALVEAYNRAVIEMAQDGSAYLLDLAVLAERVGVERWFDPVQWRLYKLPFAAELNGMVADAVGRVLGAIRGKSKRCLVLDLDNTLWGGAIGDEGLQGIALGQGSARGEAFLAVQQLALDLRGRGVILAVCSKNNDETARRPFREHPEMLLKEEHVAVFQANWVEKATNLEAIARTLNIGVDGLVLLDDNPAERAQVRAALPAVGVPELPDEPSWYPWYLTAAGYFEAVSFSVEDQLRADSYAADGRRAEVVSRSQDLGDYLTALEMVISFSRFDALGRQRITQLINKSNQFNLTTRRYTEAEVAAAEADPAIFTLQVRLRDKFGDLGMIAVVIARTAPGQPMSWTIDTWLMSCRVLGRKVEEAMRDELVRSARGAGMQRLIGIYKPTDKNNMVADHYPKLGFTLMSMPEVGTGDHRFELAIDGAKIEPLPFNIEHPSPS